MVYASTRLNVSKFDNRNPPVILTHPIQDIATGDIANILGRLSRSPYITQEVIFGGGEPITPAEYVSNGDVQE